MKQHLISKILLRQFADADGKLISFNLRHQQGKLKAPAAVAWNSEFVTHDPIAAEARWAQVENLLGKAIVQLEQGPPYSNETKEALKSAIAIHFLRRMLVRQHWDSMIDGHLSEESLRDVITGQFPSVSPDRVIRALTRQVRDESPEWFQQNLFKLASQIEGRVKQAGLEVLRARQGEFLIGDTAVLSLSNDGGVGVLPFDEAESHILPVSPHFVLALGPRDLTEEVDQAFVDQMNRMQLLTASSHLYMRPGSNLEDFIRHESALPS